MKILPKFAIAITALSILSLATVKASENCYSSKLNAVETEKCLAGSSNRTENPIQRAPTTFPVRFHGLFRDSISSVTVGRDWYSTDGKQLEISTPKVCGIAGCAAVGKDLKKIPVERILAFDMKISGTGNNASEQVQSVAITAFLFPVAAPFAAAINAKDNESYQWTVIYIDEDGQEQVESLLVSSSVPVADRYYTFLPTLIGMKPGEKRSSTKLERFYMQGAENLSLKVKSDGELLTIVELQKPWCTKSQAAEFPLISARYDLNRNKLNVLKGKLGFPPHPMLTNESNDLLWEKHLTSHPDFALWAKANPAAANKIKKCIN